MNIVMSDRLAIELQGLENQVSRYWGKESPTIVDTIVRAKAMLEGSEYKRRADRREEHFLQLSTSPYKVVRKT